MSFKFRKFEEFCRTWIGSRAARHKSPCLGPIAHQFQADTCVCVVKPNCILANSILRFVPSHH